MNSTRRLRWMVPVVVVAAGFAGLTAKADVITDWNTTAGDMVAAARLPPLPAYRALAMIQATVYDAVNAVTRSYPPEHVELNAAPGASVGAAVAAANRAMRSQLVPSQQPAIDRAYQASLSAIPAGQAKTAGLAAAERAAAAILAWRDEDGAAAPEGYRPHTTPGSDVPTVIPAAPQWPKRKPWVMASADQFRPGPPPRLTSDQWARDYNEIESMGARNSAKRSAEQTDIARFREATGPAIYFPLARSVANASGRKLTPERPPRSHRRPGDGRRADCGHGCQVSVALLAARHGHLQW